MLRCVVDTISQRQLRNQSGEVLRRVAAGESFLVANDGVPTAVLSPVRPSTQEQLVSSGLLTAPRAPRRFAAVLRKRTTAGGATEQLLTEDRGER